MPLRSKQIYGDIINFHHTTDSTADVKLGAPHSAHLEFTSDTKHTNITNAGTLTQTGATTFAGITTFNAAVDINSGAIDGTPIGAASHSTGKFTTLQATGNVNFDSGNIDGTILGANSHSTGKFTTLQATGNISLDGETTATSQINCNGTPAIVVASGKELRFGNSTAHISRVGDDLHIQNTVSGAAIDIEAPNIELKGSTAIKIVECPLIPIAPAVTTYTGDDGSIPIGSTLVNIDAGGSARTGLRFAGTGTVGQMIIVQNSGGEKLTFHNTEGTALVKSIHANHDTMEPASVYMFVSTGALWCIIGGGKGSGTQLVAS
jgi:hypothetical protein